MHGKAPFQSENCKKIFITPACGLRPLVRPPPYWISPQWNSWLLPWKILIRQWLCFWHGVGCIADFLPRISVPNGSQCSRWRWKFLGCHVDLLPWWLAGQRLRRRSCLLRRGRWPSSRFVCPVLGPPARRAAFLYPGLRCCCASVAAGGNVVARMSNDEWL